jgi:GTP pyrophosphokinase
MEWSAFELHLRHLPEREHKRVRKAFDLARKLHEGQLRKSGEPYFMHPVAVAQKIARVGADADTIIATLLHDTVEDTPITLDEIDKEFGATVTHLINGVTKLSAADIGAAPNLNEQTETLRKIFRLMQEDPRIMVIKLYDRMHNMETAQFLSPEKQHALAEETLDAYAKIADRLCMQDVRYAIEELCYQILNPELLEKMKLVRDQNDHLGHTLFKKMRDTLAHQESWFKDITMELEKKTWSKLRAQLDVEGQAVSGLSRVTLAFICPDREACYRVMGALHKPWRREDLSFQDFINSPELNGYRGLHTTIILEDGTRVRCKIRTEEMHRYAHEGITLYCFDTNKAATLEQLLPWTQRIQSLTEDTTLRSDTFWQSLQNDILGESITVHGPDDRAMQLPKGATALDGTFYLFKEKAFRIKAIRVNGKEVEPHTVLMRSNALSVELAKEPQVKREWLKWTTTAYAAALVRSKLTEASIPHRITDGRDILSRFMAEHRRGYLEEYSESYLKHKAADLGFGSTDELYLAIADGHVEPSIVFEHIANNKRKIERPRRYVFQYNIPGGRNDVMMQARMIRDSFRDRIVELRTRRLSAGEQFTFTANLTNMERAAMEDRLRAVGAQDVEVLERSRKTLPLLVTVLLLWALNPVLAKWFLISGMTPMTLIILRLLTFGTFSIVVFALWRLQTRSGFSAVPRLAYWAFAPAVGLTGMSVFNYFSLYFLAPSIHLTILRLNAILLPLLIAMDMNQKFRFLKHILLLILCAIPVLLVTITPRGIPPYGIVFAILALLSYTLYSLTTERVMQQSKISARYPILQLYMGVFMGAVGLALLSIHGGITWSDPKILQAVAYVVSCVCIPHLCYSLLLKKMRFKHMTDLFLLEVPLAILFEGMILHLTLPLAQYLMIALVLVILIYSRWSQLTMHMTR